MEELHQDNPSGSPQGEPEGTPAFSDPRGNQPANRTMYEVLNAAGKDSMYDKQVIEEPDLDEDGKPFIITIRQS